MSELIAKARPYRRWMMLIPLGLSGLWFLILEIVMPYPKYFMYARLDSYIPFLPVFIIPYVIWYVYVAIPGLVLFFKEPDEFCRYAFFIAGSMMIACTVYTFWPNGIWLRPDLTGEPGVFNAAIRFLYSIDTPTNSAPSIHVAYSVAAHAAISRHNRRNKKRRWVVPASLILCVSIILSTVFVKQHSVIDLLAGLLLATVLYFAIYGTRAARAYKAAPVPAPMCGKYAR